MNNLPRRVWLEINLATLANNYRRIAEAVAPAQVMPVLKANAYGLGVQPIARALQDVGAPRFGVAEPYEALQLLPLGKPVQILSSILPDEIEEMVARNVVLPVTDIPTAQRIEQYASAVPNGTPRVHFKIDSGMGRLGILAEDAANTILEVRRTCPDLHFEGIFTHFPMAYRGNNLTLRQVRFMRTLITELNHEGIHFECCHCAASDGINNIPQAFEPPFNLVRTGINLYGCYDPEGMRSMKTEPVLKLKTRLAAVRRLKKGMHLGYGQTYRLPCDMLIGTISAGYADGLPLALSNRGCVEIAGALCPVVGRVSMDYTMVALDQVPQAQPGDEVVCLGGQIPVDEWATLKNTHPYDIICNFGNRVERRYV